MINEKDQKAIESKAVRGSKANVQFEWYYSSFSGTGCTALFPSDWNLEYMEIPAGYSELSRIISVY
jgi:hypothetical protein